MMMMMMIFRTHQNNGFIHCLALQELETLLFFLCGEISVNFANKSLLILEKVLSLPCVLCFSQSAFQFSKWTNLHKLCCLFFVDKSPLTLPTNHYHFWKKNFDHFDTYVFFLRPAFLFSTQRSAKTTHYALNPCVTLWGNYLKVVVFDVVPICCQQL